MRQKIGMIKALGKMIRGIAVCKKKVDIFVSF